MGIVSIGAARDEDHRRLSGLAAAITEGRYPPPSDQRGSYEFQLRHAGRPVVDFTWQDYRGGAITERSTSTQAQELRKDLGEADAIIGEEIGRTYLPPGGGNCTA